MSHQALPGERRCLVVLHHCPLLALVPLPLACDFIGYIFAALQKHGVDILPSVEWELIQG